MNSPQKSVKIYLAPMEGVVDWVTRDMYSRIGGFDQMVTEFIRVTDRVVVDEVLYRYMPELKTGGRTLTGTVVLAQFLGGQPQPLADSAARAVELGALGIDLNFGCPAKTVNRHDGGATLLKFPDRIENIVATVRKNVPAHVPVSAKIRLGFDDPKMCLINAQAAEAGGAHRLTVHCRTKTDMYKPPAYWEWIPQIKEKVKIPVVANGEIWSYKDYAKCALITGCDQFMLGRGAMADPFLASRIKNKDESLPDWEIVKNWLPYFFDASADYVSPHFAQARSKQWLRQLSLTFGEAYPWLLSFFNEVKVITDPNLFKEKIAVFKN
jgi:tRNA-dihydrouridine synthase C